MVNSRNDFEDIRADIFPSTTYLMDSYTSDVLLTPIEALDILAAFITSLVKFINFFIVCVFSIILDVVSYGLYAPIGNQ